VTDPSFAEAFADLNQRNTRLRDARFARVGWPTCPQIRRAPAREPRSPGRTCRPARLYLACPDEGVRLFRTYRRE
jgi:hypothetical protein